MLARVVFLVAALLVLHPAVSSGISLILGVAIALTIGNPFLAQTRKMTARLLQVSVVGLGAGMNLVTVGRAGAQGIAYTVIGISLTLVLGLWLGRRLKNDLNTSTLVTVGTAICGGSAIAAVAPVIGAKPHEVSVALGTVFLLNAVALLIFPAMGHHFNLSETQFGLWAALAIHDTSSVVGATLQYGAHALELGTTVKLARALWIVPVAFGIGALHARTVKTEANTSAAKPNRPWFILGFLLAAAMVTWVPALASPGQFVAMIAKRSLVLTLFLIGANLSRATLKEVGMRPFIQGVALWLLVSTTTLSAILLGWIH